VSDYENGRLYTINPESYTDNGETIYTILRGKHIKSRNKVVKIASIELGIEAGVGTATGQGVDPVASLRISKDGGNSFGTSVFSKMGKKGEYTKRLIWRRLGIGRDIVPEVTITDPIKRVIIEATINVDEGL
jgi:hypothetical protein